MGVLSGKHIILGISAGIAAYKTPFLVRLLIKAGAEVKVVTTPTAQDFVTPLTLSTVSKNEVHSKFVKTEDDTVQWNNHVDLALWADLMIIAPATANTLSKMASGVADNLLLAVYLSSKCPVYYAPAMDLDMYRHGSTKANFTTLESYGNIQIPAESGELASGLVGEGRMAEPEAIVNFITDDIAAKLPLRNKKVLITAGPTYEAIDPVRFIGNHSSGKMGYALAEVAAQLGAEVILISGPVAITASHGAIKTVAVTTATEMYDAAHQYFTAVDIAIAAAAVSDYRPKTVASQKIKKKSDTLTITLEKNKDILASLGAIKKHQLLVGFALETENEQTNAKSKLKKKNLDFIVLNSLQDKDAGFQKDTNKVTIIDKEGEIYPFEAKSKHEVALDIFDQIQKRL